MSQIPYQTLSHFIDSPFGTELTKIDSDYEHKYLEVNGRKEIKVASILEMDGAYFIHVLIPSETNKDNNYDVVIQLFTDDVEVSRRTTIEDFYAKFFSNSPGFVYRYAMLYKTSGFLIESLAPKLDEKALTIAPDKTNSKMEMSYDKSIYFACRHILDNKFAYLTKMGMISKRTRNMSKFIENISDFETVKLLGDASKTERSVKKELTGDKKEATILNRKNTRTNRNNIISPKSKISAKSKVKPKKAVSKTRGTKKTSGLR